MRIMAFHKTGIAPIGEIKCSCGHEIKGQISTCPNCKKTLVPTHLQTTPEDTPSDKEEESKVK
jgi:hypothetical protein